MELIKATGHEELRQEVLGELKMLRSLVHETAEGFILRKEGEIETLLAYLLTLPPGKLRTAATPWLCELRELKLKPAKGRLKDLKRINTLLEDLLHHIIETEAVAAGKKPGAAAKKKPVASGRKSRCNVSPHDRA